MMMMMHIFMGQYSWERKKMEKLFKIRNVAQQGGMLSSLLLL